LEGEGTPARPSAVVVVGFLLLIRLFATNIVRRVAEGPLGPFKSWGDMQFLVS